MFKRKYIFPLLLVFLGGFLLWSWVYKLYGENPTNAFWRQETPKMKAINTLLEQEYFYRSGLNYTGMLENAISAYVEQEKDPYTSYFPAKINSGFLNLLKGSQDFVGIGAVVSKKDSYILVEEVLKKSPASKAGLQVLDHILSIDWASVKDLTIDEGIEKIRGEKGSEVNLKIARNIKKKWKYEIKEITITRDTINLPSVYTKILTGDEQEKILYIQLILIGEETDSLLKQELAEMEKLDDIQGIIIDVRDNGGGYLSIAVDILSHFVPEKTLLATAKYKAYPEEKYYSKIAPLIENKDIVVLVNGNTASAGEIIALALKEVLGAKILWTKTFWKGSVQTMKEFTDGSSLKYTIWKRYSPSGLNIDKEGMLPDTELEFDQENYINKKQDNQLEKAIKMLSNNVIK